MKHILNYKITSITLLLLSLMLGFSSCEKKVFENSFEFIEPDAAFSTAARIDKAAVGMYDVLQGREFLGSRAFIYIDVRSNEVNPPVVFFGNIPQFSITSTDINVEICWRDAYRSIYETNYFLKKFQPNASKVSPDKEKQYTGEAKFIRALCNFYLVNMFAQPYGFTANASHPGIPIITTAVEGSDVFDDANKVGRNTVAEVYAAIEADLTEAESKLPVTYNEAVFSNVARATKYAAQALLMRVYLYKGDNVKAADYASRLISSGQYALNANPDVAFRTYAGAGNKESIFSIAHSTSDFPTGNLTLYHSYSPAAKSEINISMDYLNLPGFSATDKRKTLLIKTSGTGTATTYWTTKYISAADWVPIIRYAEVLLTRAEALAKINPAVPNAEALDLLNQVRVRSGATPYLISDITFPADLLAKILTERKIELAFEGQGSFDFLRNGKAIPAHGNVAEQPYGSNFVIFPIPKKDIDAIPKLIQNPGY